MGSSSSSSDGGGSTSSSSRSGSSKSRSTIGRLRLWFSVENVMGFRQLDHFWISNRWKNNALDTESDPSGVFPSDQVADERGNLLAFQPVAICAMISAMAGRSLKHMVTQSNTCDGHLDKQIGGLMNWPNKRLVQLWAFAGTLTISASCAQMR